MHVGIGAWLSVVKVAWPERDFTFLREGGKPVVKSSASLTQLWRNTRAAIRGSQGKVSKYATFIVDITTTRWW